MNMNPWQVENMARYERDRIRDEVRQIRLEQKALKARIRQPSLVLKVWKLFFTRAGATGEQPTAAPSASLKANHGTPGAKI